MLRLTRRGLETGHLGTAPVLDPTCEGLEVKFLQSTRLPNDEQLDLKLKAVKIFGSKLPIGPIYGFQRVQQGDQVGVSHHVPNKRVIR